MSPESTSGAVLVTGAAGAIGSATVEAFLDGGYDVIGLDRADEVVERPEKGYRGIVVDLTDDAAVERAMARALQWGPLRHVVQIAGGALPVEPRTQDDPAELSVDAFRASIEANLTTQFTVLRACLPALRAMPEVDRSILLTSSFNALTGCGMPAYSAAKAGLVGMMHALTEPLGREGIRINVVAPGTIRTPRTEELYRDVEGHFERLEASTALGRLGVPTDVAASFLALARDLTHVTGQVLVVDGGQMVVRPRTGSGPGGHAPESSSGGSEASP